MITQRSPRKCSDTNSMCDDESPKSGERKLKKNESEDEIRKMKERKKSRRLVMVMMKIHHKGYG